MQTHYYPARLMALALGVASSLSICTSSACAEALSATPLTAELTATMQAETVIELDQRTFNMARGRVGEKVLVGKVHVSAMGLTAPVSLVPSGAVEGIFTTDVQQLPAGDSETDITIYYEAKKVGKDEGKIYFMLGEDPIEQINLKGLAIDPAITPAVKLEPAVLPEFKTEVGTALNDTIVVTLEGLPSSVNVKMTQDEPAFSCNTGLLYYSAPKQNLVITFNPKTAGTYEATITLTNEFFEPVEVKVKGTATPKTDVKPEAEGDQLPLDYTKPIKLLNETFDQVKHNKPLSLEGWKNLASIGSRAWWGYTFPDYDKENAGEFVAKVTPYDSKVEYGQETHCQMLLVTPPLDFNQAESKMFTFRVMGKGMTEGMPDRFMFSHIAETDSGLMAFPIQGVEMPSTPDQNGEWLDYHVDLSNLYEQLGDVFHIGFLFDGYRGTISSTQYYIDDVSFGRTDLPVITPNKQDVYLTFTPNIPMMSEQITVETFNLVDPVKLTLGGRDKASFELSSPQLPKEGGQFFVKFTGKEDFQHEAYVKLSSRGAATRFIAFFAATTTGIQVVETVENDRVEVIDMNGRVLRTMDGASVATALSSLPKGNYILRITGKSGSRSVKIMK